MGEFSLASNKYGLDQTISAMTNDTLVSILLPATRSQVSFSFGSVTQLWYPMFLIMYTPDGRGIGDHGCTWPIAIHFQKIMSGSAESRLLVPLHVAYIKALGDVRIFQNISNNAWYNAAQNKDDLAYHMTAHLRLNAIYWGLMALCTMNHKDALDRDEVIEFVMSCWDEEQGSLVCNFPRFDFRSNKSSS
jgi:hypothetical protein